MANEYQYKRVLLKLSGEALAGDLGYGIDPKVVDDLADEIAEIVHDGVQLAVVVGGGNIFRGVSGATEGMDRACTSRPTKVVVFNMREPLSMLVAWSPLLN